MVVILSVCFLVVALFVSVVVLDVVLLDSTGFSVKVGFTVTFAGQLC